MLSTPRYDERYNQSVPTPDHPVSARNSLSSLTTGSYTTLSSPSQEDMQESDQSVSNQSIDGAAQNALGLTYIQTTPPSGQVAPNAIDSCGVQAPPSGGMFARGTAFPPFAPVVMPPQPSISAPHFFMHNPEHRYTQNGVMAGGTVPLNDVQYSYPVYVTGGQHFVTSPSYVPYDQRADQLPMQYMNCPSSMSVPAYQYTTAPFTYAPIPSQSSRPVSSSSSSSPEETLMTPLLVNETHFDRTTHYMTPMTTDASFSASSTMMGLAHGAGDMSCATYPQSGFSAHGNHMSGPSQLAPSQAQPPPLPRRHTGELPFSDTPLSRSGPRSYQPYGLTYHPLRQPSTYTDSQGNPLPNAVMSRHNTYMAKQRIACEGCRSKKLKCTGSRPVCYNCAKKGRTQCQYVTEIKRRGPGKKRLESEAKAKTDGYFTESTSGIPSQFAFWTGQGDGQ